MAFSLLLDQPAIRQRALPLSVEQYHFLGAAGLFSEDVELLEGIVVEKMAKSPLHSSTIQRLLKVLRAVLSAELDVRQEQPITTTDSEPEPDLAVVSARADDYSNAHPTTATLVVEVAVSSAEFDYQKRAIYAAAGIREYWIVLPETRRVEAYTDPVDGDYTGHQSFMDLQIIVSKELPAFKMSLGDLFRA